MDKLKPCPFCGSLAWVHAHGTKNIGLGYRVECEGDCHAMTCYWHTKGEAVSAWNRRADKPRESDAEKKTG